MTRPQYILGLNAYHGDASAALLRDGVLVGAIAEERLRRVKHWAGVPTLAIRALLQEAGIRGADLHAVAIGKQPSAHRWRKLRYIAERRPSLTLLHDRWRQARSIGSLTTPLEQALECEQTRLPRVHYVEHHQAHMASTYYASPFSEAACATFDGFGDFVSTSLGAGHGTTLEVLDRVYFPHSLGIFYSALTQYLGFPHYGDEYKVMALAAYGTSRWVPSLQSLVQCTDSGFVLDLQYFRHWSAGSPMQWENGAPTFDALYSPALESLLGPARDPAAAMTQREADIAYAVQHIYEAAVFHVLRQLYDRTQHPRLCLAGGCALNAAANGKIRRATPFAHVFVPPAAADDGTALGAAWHVWHANKAHERAPAMTHAYWGPTHYELPTVQGLTSRFPLHEMLACTSTDELVRTVALWLANGEVVGWYQGGSEWGARALGHRSILADPRRGEMRDYLNAKVKDRESFRPFAPSVTIDAFPDFFDHPEPNAFMTEVCRVHESQRSLIPAVVHIDGTARVQAVRRADNPVFYDLLTAFGRLTGLPVLLNTSLNEHEPIVETPDEALDCFMQGELDAIVIGMTILRRPSAQPLQKGEAMFVTTMSDSVDC